MAIVSIGLVSGTYVALSLNDVDMLSASTTNQNSIVELAKDIDDKKLSSKEKSIDNKLENTPKKIKSLNSIENNTDDTFIYNGLSVTNGNYYANHNQNTEKPFAYDDPYLPEDYDYTDKYILCLDCGKYVPLGKVTEKITDSLICKNPPGIDYAGLKEKYLTGTDEIKERAMNMFHYTEKVNKLKTILSNNVRQVEGTYFFVSADVDYEDSYWCCCECGGYIYLGEHNNQLKDYQKCLEHKSIVYITPNVLLNTYEEVSKSNWHVPEDVEHSIEKIDQLEFDYYYNLTVHPDTTPLVSPDELKQMYGDQYYPKDQNNESTNI